MLAILATRFRLGPRPRLALWNRWTAHRHRRACHDSLERLLARSDDRLLDDAALDRSTARDLIGETLLVPHRAWDRWQL